MNTLRKKLLQNTSIDLTDTLTDSKIYGKKDNILTTVPTLNIALSGSPFKGLTPGLTMIAGPSKHFKSNFALVLAKAYLKQNTDGMILFYDSEFGTPESYFESLGIPGDRVVHTPIKNIDELKFDLVKQFKGIERGDKILIIIDSVGNLASAKEVADAEKGNDAADMGARAKAFKSFYRVVTPYFTLKDIPGIIINHTYQELSMYATEKVGGGRGGILASDNIWIIGRQQDKDNKEKELQGWHFIINIEKSRYVKEKSKFAITVNFDKGIKRWSGLFDIALEGGFIVMSRKGKSTIYPRVNKETGEVAAEGLTRVEIENDGKFWKSLLEDQAFVDYIESTYKLSDGPLLVEDEDGENI